MHLTYILFLSTVALCGATPVLNSYKPSWSNFASESANKLAPFYDLSEFGIQGGQLPKHYDISNGTIVYMAEESFKIFNEILSGQHNVTEVVDHAADAGKRGLEERTCNFISMALYGDCGTFNYNSNCVDNSYCITQSCPWSSVTVFGLQNAYITFWSSNACNGSKGSFNPYCNSDSEQVCQFNIRWESFRVYSGCHDTYQSNC